MNEEEHTSTSVFWKIGNERIEDHVFEGWEFCSMQWSMISLDLVFEFYYSQVSSFLFSFSSSNCCSASFLFLIDKWSDISHPFLLAVCQTRQSFLSSLNCTFSRNASYRIQKNTSYRMKLSLDTLPPHLIYRILDNLSQAEIVLSSLNVCTRLNAIITSYHPYAVSISALALHHSRLYCRHLPHSI